MEDLVAMRLVHLGVNEEAGVAQLSDLLGQQLHPLHRVAEDDALVDLEFGEERVEAVNLLPLLNIGIILSHALECEFVHKIDGVGGPQMLIL